MIFGLSETPSGFLVVVDDAKGEVFGLGGGLYRGRGLTKKPEVQTPIEGPLIRKGLTKG